MDNICFSCDYQLLKLVVIIFWEQGPPIEELCSDRDLQVKATDHRNINTPEKRKERLWVLQQIMKAQCVWCKEDRAHTDPAGSLV